MDSNDKGYEPLEGPPPVGTNMRLDEAKVFRRRVLIMRFDEDELPNRSVDFATCTAKTEMEIENPVPVIVEYDRQIGYANVVREGKFLYADLYLDPQCPERLDIETRARKLFPTVTAYINELQGDPPIEVRKARLAEIVLVPAGNADPRIPSVDEPQL